MLTVTCEPNVIDAATRNTLAQNETTVSDVEVSRRVLQIRSSWSIAERIRRRHEAERRFEDLMNALYADAA